MRAGRQQKINGHEDDGVGVTGEREMTLTDYTARQESQKNEMNVKLIHRLSGGGGGGGETR